MCYQVCRLPSDQHCCSDYPMTALSQVLTLWSLGQPEDSESRTLSVQASHNLLSKQRADIVKAIGNLLMRHMHVAQAPPAGRSCSMVTMLNNLACLAAAIVKMASGALLLLSWYHSTSLHNTMRQTGAATPLLQPQAAHYQTLATNQT